MELSMPNLDRYHDWIIFMPNIWYILGDKFSFACFFSDTSVIIFIPGQDWSKYSHFLSF